MAKDAKSKAIGGGSDIYTALLGLATFALAATTAIVCIYSLRMWGDIFRSTA